MNETLCLNCRHNILVRSGDGYMEFRCDWEMQPNWDIGFYSCVSECSQYEFDNWQKGRRDDEPRINV